MSVPSSTTSSDMVERGYLRAFGLSVAVWFGLFLAFTWIIDPYGVSPVQLGLHRINAVKPARVDIDRLIKPLEVWRYQPRTVLLGTSRIHQGFDPAVLDGTSFGPAYNAAIPGATVKESAANLEQFFRLDKNLRVVFVDLYLYSFAGSRPPPFEKSSFLETTSSLFLSAGSLLDALRTVAFNVLERPRMAHIAPGGYWVAPHSFRTSFDQQTFLDAMMKYHHETPTMSFQSTAFAELDRIVDLCRRNDARLYLLIVPSYPWDDYRLLSMGDWPVLEHWLKRMSAYPNVISFSQYNEVLEEPPEQIMTYWNDPFHFNTHMGRLMLRSILGASDPDIPANFLRPVTSNTVEAVMHERRAGLDQWIDRNRQFTTVFDRAKLLAGNGTPRLP